MLGEECGRLVIGRATVALQGGYGVEKVAGPLLLPVLVLEHDVCDRSSGCYLGSSR